MGMKGNIGALMAITALFDNDMANYGREKRVRVEPDTEGEKATKKKLYQEVLRDKGLQWFSINGYTVLALNQKNAERKAVKMRDRDEQFMKNS